MNEALRKTLKQLRLSGLLESLEIRLQEAAGHGLSHGEFLELILQDELAVRGDRQLERRFKAAQFRERKSLQDFDWSFNPSIPRKQVYDLASCRFLREGRDVLWLGPPGVGKSFLVQAIGYQAIKTGYTVFYRSIFDLVRDFLHDEVLGQEDKMLTKYLKPELLIIDDMGMKQLPRRSGECLFEVVMRRYETRSTMMTSNRPLEDWGKLLGDVPSATAILDRFLHHAELVRMTGRSYRLRHHSGPGLERVEDSKPANAPSGSEEKQPSSKPANAPPGSKGRRPSSKPANAPSGSEEQRPSSKPANAPPGSEGRRPSSKPANAPSGSDVSEDEEA
jgi:DNA replication protein DnaC